jgi:hypothetical protein
MIFLEKAALGQQLGIAGQVGSGSIPPSFLAVLDVIEQEDLFFRQGLVNFAIERYIEGRTAANALLLAMFNVVPDGRQPVSLDGQIVHVPVGPRYCVQGAPTSPGLCNAICLRLDRRLSGLARKYGCDYTRYADDITFSGPLVNDLKTIRRLARHICREEGFTVHPAKTRIMRQGRKQAVTGVTVNQIPGLSRKERRRLRAVIHRLRTNSPDRPATLSASQLAGKLAYLHMLNPQQAASLRSRLDDAAS